VEIRDILFLIVIFIISTVLNSLVHSTYFLFSIAISLIIAVYVVNFISVLRINLKNLSDYDFPNVPDRYVHAAMEQKGFRIFVAALTAFITLLHWRFLLLLLTWFVGGYVGLFLL
jgi:hypothetical protein